jgi:hypothetical protein
MSGTHLDRRLRQQHPKDLLIICTTIFVLLSTVNGNDDLASSFEGVLDNGEGNDGQFPRYYDEKTMRIVEKEDSLAIG